MEFRRLLVRLSKLLSRADVEALILLFRLPKLYMCNKESDLSLYALEAMRYIDPLDPDKLQEALTTIGRADLAHWIREYKKSDLYKKVIFTKGKDWEYWEALGERHVVSSLSEIAEERRRDMILTQTEQLVEQTELLCKTIEAHGDIEALYWILVTQEKVESLSKTLKKTLKKAGGSKTKAEGDCLHPK